MYAEEKGVPIPPVSVMSMRHDEMSAKGAGLSFELTALRS
jgi:hypothetical protein